ncbi:MAG: hypothetical protein V3U52_03430 [Thermoplasmata archaeon]
MATESGNLRVPLFGAVLIVGLLVTGIAALPFQPFHGAIAQTEDTVEFWILGVEFKGTAGAGEPYIDEGDKVESYMFFPETIRVQKGQNVILNFLGINGGSGHPTTIENYVTQSFTFMRNQTVTKEFVADEAGVFAITCSRHQPTMNAYLIVEDPEAGGAMGVSTIGLALLAVQAAVLAITVAVVVIGRRGGRS